MTDEEIDKKFYDMAMEHKLGSSPEKFMIDGEEVALTIRMDTTGGAQFKSGGQGLICDFLIPGRFSITYTFPYLEYDQLVNDVEYSFSPIADKERSFFSSKPINKVVAILLPYTRDDLIHWLMIIELTKARI